MQLKSPFISVKTEFSDINCSDKFRALLQILITEQDCEIARLIYCGLAYSRYVNPSKKFNHITFREKQGLFSYQPYGREQKYNADGKWVRDGRQEIKPAKFAKEFIHPRLIAKFKDHEIAAFATRFKAFEESRQIDFHIVDVHEAYNASYERDINSCMAGKDVTPFYSLFGTKAVVAKRKNGKYCGRALLWDNVQITGHDEPQTFLDRIYATSEEVTELFLQWVKDRKIWYKDGQNNGSYKNYISPLGKKTKAELIVKTLDNKSLRSVDFYPYLDTLLYGSDDFSITNNPMQPADDEEDDESDDRSYAIYRSTNGDRNINTDLCFVTDYQGNSIRLDRATLMSDGRYYPLNSPLIVVATNTSYMSDYYFRKDCFQADDGMFYTNSCKDVMVITDVHGKYYHKNDLTTIDGLRYHRSEVVYCQTLDRYMLESECMRVYHTAEGMWGTLTPKLVYVPKGTPGYALDECDGRMYLKSEMSLDTAGRLVYTGSTPSYKSSSKDYFSRYFDLTHGETPSPVSITDVFQNFCDNVNSNY